MQSTQLSLIVKKLTEFYGGNFDNFTEHSSLLGIKNYTLDEIDLFITDLSQVARKQNFLLVEKHISKENFPQLLKNAEHPIIFFEENKIIVAGRLLKNHKPFVYQLSNNQAFV